MRTILCLATLIGCAPDTRGTADATAASPDCSDASKLVYTIDQNNTLSSFAPATKTFTDLGMLSCPTGSRPFSMAVDRNTIAWVLYRDGSLFRVDILNGLACTSSTWSAPSSMMQFGMGFSTDTAGTSEDRLFVAGASLAPAATTTLGVLDTSSLALTTRGTLEGWPELTGNSNAELWGWFPSDASGSTTPRIEHLDKTSGAALETFSLPALRAPTLAWAFAYWGGDYWVFQMTTLDANATSIYQVDGSTGAIKSSTPTTMRQIVGAGVSTCAPTVLL